MFAYDDGVIAGTGSGVPDINRVIRILMQAVEVEPHNPNMFWSASEDGTVRQFDKRCRCGYIVQDPVPGQS